MRLLPAVLLVALLPACTRELTELAPFRQPTCADRVQNGDETDVDCGGSCDACGAARACAGAGDCASGVCTIGLCAEPACNDAVMNGDETGVDCGGRCDGCAAAVGCREDGDCADNACSDAGVCLRVHDGSILIRELAEVDQLAGIEVLRGTLTIRSQTLTSLPALSLLRVEGDVIVAFNRELTALTGFATLTSVTGTVRITGNRGLTSLAGFAALREVGSLEISDDEALTSLAGAPLLLTIHDDLELKNLSSLTTLAGLENVRTVGGDLVIEENAQLVDVSGLSQLEDCGGIVVDANSVLAGIDGFDALTLVNGDIIFDTNPALAAVTAFPVLTDIGGVIEILSNPLLTEIAGFAQLSFAGGVSIHNNAVLADLDGFPALEYVAQTVEVRDNPGLEAISGFGSLRATGALFLIDLVALPSITGFASLETVDSTLQVARAAHLVDLSGLASVSKLGNVVIDSLPELAALPSWPVAGEILSLSLADLPLVDDLTPLGAITEVAFDVTLRHLGITQLSPFAPVRVGRLTIDGNTSLTDIDSLAALTEVTARAPRVSTGQTVSSRAPVSLAIVNNSSLAHVDTLTSLLAVNGELSISSNALLQTLDLSAVETLTGGFGARDNPVLTSIVGPSAQTMGAIEIKNCPLLTSLTGFDGLTQLTGAPPFDLASSFFDNGIMVINTALVQLNQFPALHGVASMINIDSNPSLQGISFALLDSIEELIVTANPVLTTLSFPQLDTCGDVTISNNGSLDCVDAETAMLASGATFTGVPPTVGQGIQNNEFGTCD